MVRHAQTVVAKDLTEVAAEVAVPGPVAIVWHFTNVNVVVLGDAPAIPETLIRAFVGFVGYGRSLDNRPWTTKVRFTVKSCRYGCYRRRASNKVSSRYFRFLSFRNDGILLCLVHVLAP